MCVHDAHAVRICCEFFFFIFFFSILCVCVCVMWSWQTTTQSQHTHTLKCILYYWCIHNSWHSNSYSPGVAAAAFRAGFTIRFVRQHQPSGSPRKPCCCCCCRYDVATLSVQWYRKRIKKGTQKTLFRFLHHHPPSHITRETLTDTYILVGWFSTFQLYYMLCPLCMCADKNVFSATPQPSAIEQTHHHPTHIIRPHHQTSVRRV